MRPNILFITCDQLRLDALGCYGNDVIRTPVIDRLASAGVRLDQMQVASPVCAPNRASIATGRMPSVHGLRLNGCSLPSSELTLMECLRQAGYATYGVGKMHFRPQWTYPPGDEEGIVKGAGRGEGAVNPQPFPWEFPYYGFTHGAFSEDNREGPYANYLRARGLDPWADPHSYSYPQSATVRSAWPEEHHQTTWVADRSIDYLEKHPADQPFFMWTSFVHPHHPFNPPAPFDTMYNPADMPLPIRRDGEEADWPARYIRKLHAASGSHESIGMDSLPDAEWQRIKAFYYGMISLIDKQVGRLLETLRKRGQLDNTWIVFTSDHGELLGDHRLCFKGVHFDCVNRIPCIIRPPADLKMPSGNRDALCQSTDLMPTILECANLRIPATVQGRSLLPVLTKQVKQTHSEVLVETTQEMRTLRTPTHRFTWHGVGETGELYDLTVDPYELRNLWNSVAHQELRADLADRLIAKMAENVDPVPAPATIA